MTELRTLPAGYTIVSGHHEDCDPEQGNPGCVMDLVAWACGYATITDTPPCASEVATRFAIAINDAMPDDATRTRLLSAVIPLLAGSKASMDVEMRRAFLFVDRAVRVFAPASLDADGLQEEADKLRALPEITSAASADSAARAAWAANAASADSADSADSAASAASAASTARAARAAWAANAASAAQIWELAVAALVDALAISETPAEMAAQA